MEIYDTEEEQIAAVKRWWKENGTSTIAGVVIGLVIIFGWNFWKSYTEEKTEQASAMYQQLLEAIKKGKSESAEKIGERLIKQYDTTAYADFAQLLVAKAKVQQGDLEAAKAILEKLMQTADTDELQHVARIRLIRLLMAAGKYEEGLKLIAETDPTKSEGFSATYDELKGDLYVALDRVGEARTAYQTALREGSRSPLLQFKLDDVSEPQVLENDNVNLSKSFTVK